MNMKTERITVLATPEFKVFLAKEAKAEGISVSELVRQRCEQRPGPDEQLLRALAEQLKEANQAASDALDAGLAAVERTRATLRQLRKQQAQQATA